MGSVGAVPSHSIFVLYGRGCTRRFAIRRSSASPAIVYKYVVRDSVCQAERDVDELQRLHASCGGTLLYG